MAMYDFSNAFANLNDAIGSIGTLREKQRTRDLAGKIGMALQGGNYMEGAKAAFAAGDVHTGLALIKAMQEDADRKQDRSNVNEANQAGAGPQAPLGGGTGGARGAVGNVGPGGAVQASFKPPGDGDGPIPKVLAYAPVGSGADVDTETGAPPGLFGNESGMRWNARNNAVGAGGLRGHFGRAQFGVARLNEAKEAGVIPADMTVDQFMASPEAQMAAERWHFGDIEAHAKTKGYDQLVGQTINGVPITMAGMKAAAHLGGKKGLDLFIQSGGRYNPQDINRTRLSDYFRRFAGPQTASADLPAPGAAEAESGGGGQGFVIPEGDANRAYGERNLQQLQEMRRYRERFGRSPTQYGPMADEMLSPEDPTSPAYVQPSPPPPPQAPGPEDPRAIAYARMRAAGRGPLPAEAEALPRGAISAVGPGATIVRPPGVMPPGGVADPAALRAQAREVQLRDWPAARGLVDRAGAIDRGGTGEAPPVAAPVSAPIAAPRGSISDFRGDDATVVRPGVTPEALRARARELQFTNWPEAKRLVDLAAMIEARGAGGPSATPPQTPPQTQPPKPMTGNTFNAITNGALGPVFQREGLEPSWAGRGLAPLGAPAAYARDRTQNRPPISRPAPAPRAAPAAPPAPAPIAPRQPDFTSSDDAGSRQFAMSQGANAPGVMNYGNPREVLSGQQKQAAAAARPTPAQPAPKVVKPPNAGYSALPPDAGGKPSYSPPLVAPSAGGGLASGAVPPGGPTPSAAPASQPSGGPPVAPVTGDNPAALRQQAASLAQSNPEAARQLTARADAAESKALPPLGGGAAAPAAAPAAAAPRPAPVATPVAAAPAAAPAEVAAAPQAEPTTLNNGLTVDQDIANHPTVRRLNALLGTTRGEGARAAITKKLDLVVADLKTQAPPEDVRKFLYARQHGLTKAPNLAAFAAEQAGRRTAEETTKERETAAERAGLKKDSPAYQKYVLTGQMPGPEIMTATDRQAIDHADMVVLESTSFLDNMRKAKELSKQAYEGLTAGIRGKIGAHAFIDDPAAVATEDLNNIVSMASLQNLKNIFGGQPSDKEGAMLREVQGSADKPQKVRDAIYDRAILLAEQKLRHNQEKAVSLRGGTYYKPGGAPSTAGGAGAPPPAAANDDELRRQALEELQRRQAARQGGG